MRLLDDGAQRLDRLEEIAVVVVAVGALERARSARAEALAEHFLAIRARPGRAAEISADAKDRLACYAYPGNVRELRNVVERAAMLAGPSGRIEVDHLDLIAGRSPDRPAGEVSEKDRIKAVLDECLWNRREAARRLGMAYSTLRHKIQLFGLGQS